MIVLGIFIGIIVISFINFIIEVKKMIEKDEENKEEY